MNLKYINQVKANISIYSNKKSSNILDGSYKSVYRGKSMNFENLREYVINDDVKDIDWKASARSANLLVKQFNAEKKHNILIVMDTGIKMDGDTNISDSKKDVALYSAGTIGYLAIKNGDYVGMLYNQQDRITYKPFRYNLYNLEQYLTDFDKYATVENQEGIEKSLEYAYKYITKKMIIFIITDLQGMETISLKTIKKLSAIHDVLLINISDAYFFGEKGFDLDNKSYIPSFITEDAELYTLEKEIKKEVFTNSENKLRKNKVSVTTVNSVDEIPQKIIELLERHKNANIR